MFLGKQQIILFPTSSIISLLGLFILLLGCQAEEEQNTARLKVIYVHPNTTSQALVNCSVFDLSFDSFLLDTAIVTNQDTLLSIAAAFQQPQLDRERSNTINTRLLAVFQHEDGTTDTLCSDGGYGLELNGRPIAQDSALTRLLWETTKWDS